MSDQSKMQKNTVILANANELTTKVIMKVAGNAVANRIDGEQLTPGILTDTVTAKIQTRLAKHLEG